MDVAKHPTMHRMANLPITTKQRILQHKLSRVEAEESCFVSYCLWDWLYPCYEKCGPPTGSPASPRTLLEKAHPRST